MTDNDFLIDVLQIIKEKVFDKCGFIFSNFQKEAESREYAACRFKINDKKIVFRTAKITPKKIGLFVTVWKRAGDNPIEPFEESDEFDAFVINARQGDGFGFFVFPKSVLLKKGVITSEKKDGKRGIRVYPPWCSPTSKQAIKTQTWQVKYFLEIKEGEKMDIEQTEKLFSSLG